MPAGGSGSKRKDVHERALGLLAVRARSRRELERRLLQAGFDRDEEVDPELQRLERVGLIDDEAFAQAVAEQAFGPRREGRRAVAARLFAAGVSRETAEAVLDAGGADEEARAFGLASQRVTRLAGLPREKAFQRLSGLLMRRGYAPDVARGAALRALDLQVDA